MKQSEIRANVGGEKINLEHVLCNLCGNNDTREVFRARDNRYDTCDFEFSVVECKSCGLAYLNPRPDIVSIQAFYPERFFGNRDNTEQALKKYRTELNKIEQTSGKLLDVGCANGGFLKYAKDHGFEADGLETAKNTHTSEHLKIYKSFKEIKDSQYDVVTAWAVFEHLHDPMSYFKEIKRLLKRNGHFIFLVPNFSSFRSKAMGYEDIPRHLLFYAPKTIRQYLKKASMRLDNIEQDNSIYYGGHRKFLVYLGLRWIGRAFTPCHQKNLWESYKKGDMPLWEMLYLTPFEHIDRLVHRSISKWFANKGMNGTMIVYASNNHE